MKALGSFIKIKEKSINGYIMGYSKLKAGYFGVMIWDDESSEYILVHAHPLAIVELHQKKDIKAVNKLDQAGREMWAAAATEMALAMNDKQWFDEIQEARLEQRALAFMDDETFEENVQQVLVDVAVDTKDYDWYHELIKNDKLFD